MCTHMKFSSVQLSRSVMSDSLRSHESQHARPPYPSPTPGVHPNSCPLCWWCHPTISSSASPFSSRPQSFPASGSFSNELVLCIRWPKHWSFSFSVSPSNEYSGLISFRLTSLISLLSKGLSRVFFSTAFQKHRFFGGNRVGPWEKKVRNSVSESMVQDACIGGTIAFYTPNSVKYSYTVPSENVFANSHCWEWEVSLKGYFRKPKTSGVSTDDFFFSPPISLLKFWSIFALIL